MATPDIQSLIIELGTEAVLRYRTISESRNDSAIPEIFLGGFIASKLYDRVRCPIHIERLYTKMAVELGISLTPDLTDLMGGHRADMAIYERDIPSHVVEFKIFDERNRPAIIAYDLDKAKRLASQSQKPVAVILGVMICQTSGSLESRIGRLQDELGSALKSGETQWSADGRWEWCFGSYLSGAI